MNSTMSNMNELDYLMARFNVYYDFITQETYDNRTPPKTIFKPIDNDDLSKGYIECEVDKDEYVAIVLEYNEKYMKRPMEEAYKNKNIRYLRAMNKEINYNIVETPPYYKARVAAVFKEKLGEDIYLLDTKRMKKIEELKRRGVIKTKAEHILIEQRIEEIYGSRQDPCLGLDEEQASEVEQLNNLARTSPWF